MPKPSNEQLDLINKLAVEPRTEEDTYVFKTLMIDDQETSYISLVHPNLLRKFLKDASKGVGLLLSHDNSRLPVGRTYTAELKEELDERNPDNVCKSLYGEVYIDLGRNTEGGMSTDDLAKGIASGTIFDVSVGFNAEQFNCSVCGNDIRDYFSCPHIPGENYEIKDEEEDVYRQQKCQVIVGENGAGELLELSLVYAGACDRASIKRNFMQDSVKSYDNSSTLKVVEDIKKIPLNAVVYQQFSKGGHSMFYVEGKTQGAGDKLTENTVKKGSVDKVNYLEILNAKLGLDITEDSQVEGKLEELAAKLTETQEEAKTAKEGLTKAKEDMDNYIVELAEKDEEISKLTADNELIQTSVEELKAEKEELLQKAEVAETYRTDLIESTLEAGIRSQGNAFRKEMFNKFLATLSIDEIKDVKDGFESEFKEKFNKVSKSEDRSLNNRKNEPEVKEDFEDEGEYRNYIAEKALAYSKENGVTVAEATKIVVRNLKNKRSE